MNYLQFLVWQLFRTFKPYESPSNLKFTKGQKVECHVTHEVPFSKVTQGTIVCYAFKKKSYWAFKAEPSDWYVVRYRNGWYMILPQERLVDLKEKIEDDKRFLEMHRHRLGEKGFSFEAFDTMNGKINEGIEFLN